jgi:membrane protease subunit (stomatin/prohibitin family)
LELVGTQADFTIQDIEENLRGKIGMRIKEVMPEIGVPVIDLESKVSVVGQRILEKIAGDFEQYGLELCEVQVQDIGLPEEVEKAIDQQGAMRAIGNMQQFAQYQGAQALRDAAQNPGMAGAMMGVGVGGMLNQSMGNLFAANNTAPAAAAGAVPPPLPGATPYFVAVNGAQAGPFERAALQAQVVNGTLTRDSLVWRQGMPAWAKASDQADLQDLFAAMPPPLPPQ